MMKTDEDRNVIRVLGGHSEFLESDGNALEVSGDTQSLGFCYHIVRVLEDCWNGVRGAVGDQSWIGTGSQQLDRDLNNLTVT